MRVLIVEDEPAAAERLERMIKEATDPIEITGMLDSIEGVIDWYTRNAAPDLLFMDIQLADGECFEIFRHINIDRPVIFTTAYDQYAMQAFRVNVVDYLLKPIKKKDLAAALDKYRNFHRTAPIDYARLARLIQPNLGLRRFLIRIGQHLKTVETKDVAYFFTENKITFLMTKAGKRYPIDYSLEKLEELLDDQVYFRINRQFIISVQSIGKMITVSKSRVKIELSPPCPIDTIVSTERSGKFKKWLVGV